MAIQLRSAIALWMSLQASLVLACGFCVEDQVASVYDHAIVTQALSRQHHIAFFAIAGPIVPGDGADRAIRTLTAATAGIDKGSVKVSIAPAALSFSFNPKQHSLASLQKALNQKLASRQLSLRPLRTMDKAATLNPVASKP